MGQRSRVHSRSSIPNIKPTMIEATFIEPASVEHKLIIIFCQSYSCFFTFDPLALTWTQKIWRGAASGTSRSHAGAAVIGDSLYMVGGERTSPFLGFMKKSPDPSIEVVNISSMRSSVLPTQVSPTRAHHTVVAHDRQLFLISGCGFSTNGEVGNTMTRVDVLNLRTLKWSTLPALKTGRRRCRAVVHQDKLIVIGGRHDDNSEILNGEIFSFETNLWARFHITTPQTGFAVALRGDKIMFVGGNHNGKTVGIINVFNLDSLGKQSPQQLFQTPSASIRIPLAFTQVNTISAAWVENQLFVFTREHAVMYDAVSGEWTTVCGRHEREHNVTAPLCLISTVGSL
jgi:hypothetical protein